MLWYGWRICFGVPADFENKEEIAKQCLEVANAAHFPTDYKDVYDHLFGNEDYTICLAFDEDGSLDGFSVFAKLRDISTVFGSDNLTFISARTHNPRMFETLTRFAIDSKEFYPNVSNDVIPESIYELVKKNEFTESADEYLIVREAYPDEKIAQTFRNEKIANIFKRLNARDAQVIVVRAK